jgi:hypothetical protein
MPTSIDEILGKEEEHPSYGAITISRVTSGRAEPLFGSSIKHSTFIRLRIHKSSLRRNLNTDRHFAGDHIVEVDLSPAQFAEAITSHGLGSGTPCTIRSIHGKQVPSPTIVSKQEQFAAEFADDVKKVGTKLDNVIAEMQKFCEQPNFGKRERQEFLKRLENIRMEISSNMPFVAEQFTEQMHQTVHEAKSEVEAFVSMKIHDAGLQALTNQGERPPVFEIESSRSS